MVRKKNLHQVSVLLCRVVSNVLNKSMKQSCWAADGSVASQGKFCPWRNRNFHYRFHKNPWFFIMRVGTSRRILAQARDSFWSSTVRFVVFCFTAYLYNVSGVFVRIRWPWWLWVREHKDLREVGTKLILQTQHFRRPDTQITRSRCSWLLSHQWLLHTACSLGSTRQSSLNHYGVQAGGWAGESF